MRDLSFDYMKGFLIFLVILGHFILYVEGVSPNFDPIWKIIYSFHMPLFVLLSGYFFRNSTEQKISFFFKKKMKRLLLPQLTFVILGFLIMPISWENFSHFIAINGEVNVKPLYHYITFAWFLWCIFFCSIFINIITRIFGKRMPYIVIALCVIMFVAFEYLPGVVFKNQQIAKQFIFFAIGMWFREYHAVFSKYKTAILLISVLVVSYYLPSLLSSKIHFVSYHEWMILAFAMCPIMYYLVKQLYNISIFKNTLIYWGQNTLGLYVIHVFIMSFTFSSFEFKFSTGNIYGDYILCIIFSIIFINLINLLIKFLQYNRVTKLLFLGES